MAALLLASVADPAWASTGQTLFTTQTPSVNNGTHGGTNYEKGLAFYTVAAGQITAVRFWKSSSESGTHVGKIWSSGGTLLASVTFVNETASGWQQQSLASPLSIAANTTYIVSVNTTKGYFVYTDNVLNSQVVNGSLRSVVGNNGQYASSGQFPSNGTAGTNFFRDVVFVPAALSSLGSVALSPSTVNGGSSSTGTVTLTSSAPSGGAVVTLSSNNAAATVPASVTVGAGSTTGTFTVNTSAVGVTTSASISGSYNGSKSATLTINSPVLSTISLNPSSVTGGTASTGTAILTGPAPAGGALVALSAFNPIVAGIQGVHSPADLPQDGSIDWSTTGPLFGSLPSSPVLIAGMPGSTVTVATATALAPQILNNCSGTCGWYGNFLPGASVIWVGGTYNGLTGGWAANGPLTISFSSPQRGLGFQIMADESGPFTATVCAYSSTNALLGCVPFSGNGSVAADGSAVFIGLYDDVAEISRVTVDAGGALYPHDFAIGQVHVANTRRQMVPASVTVPAGATGVTFPVSTSAVSTNTVVAVNGSYVMTRSASLSVNPPVLSAISLNPTSVTGGASSTGTATLTGPAPVGGVAVTLSAVNPIFSGIQGVHSPADLPQDGSIDWGNLSPLHSSVSSGVAVPIAGLAGSTMTISTTTGLPAQIEDNCSGTCGWHGNFLPGASVLWMGGTYNGLTGGWAPNGPLTISFSSPQRGLGFQIMADESGPFTATVCAYNSTNALLGCVPFSGNGSGAANGSAIFIGLYDDVAEISRVTVDAGGALYPHDFAIGQVHVAGTRRQLVPASVTVPPGATSATFAVTANSVNTSTSVNISGSYGGSRTVTLDIHP